MKFRKISQYFLAASLALATSCSKDNLEELKPENTSISGKVIIVNEGDFTKPTASLSVVNEDLTQARNNVYGTANGDAPLGSVLQNIGFNGNYAYLVTSTSNDVKIVDRNTCKRVGTITEGIKTPRYVAFANGYTYITNDAYLGEKKVSIYKSSDFSYVKSINFAPTSAAEVVVEAGGKIFVQNASFGYGKNISIIGSNNEVEKTITLTEDIKKIISYNGSVYVLSADATNSKISIINPSTGIVSSIESYAVGEGSKLTIDSGLLFFTVGAKIYKVELSNPKEFEPYYSLYGFNLINGKLYTSESNEFKSDSDVTVYSAKDASVLQTFKTGIGTNGFYLNK
jgi:hypothetical protein